MWRGVKRNLMAGMLFLLPAGLTIWFTAYIWYFVNGPIYDFLRLFDREVLKTIDPPTLTTRFVGWLLDNHIDLAFLSGIPGLGIIVVFLTILLAGMIARTLAGRYIIGISELVLHRLPILGRVYKGIKQIAEAVFDQSSTAFQEAVLLEYPRRGLWSIGFVTSPVKSHIRHSDILDDEDQEVMDDDTVFVFVPTTPNPTSGVLVAIPRSHTRPLPIAVDDAIKLVISGGMVQPKSYTEGSTCPLETPHVLLQSWEEAKDEVRANAARAQLAADAPDSPGAPDAPGAPGAPAVPHERDASAAADRATGEEAVRRGGVGHSDAGGDTTRDV